LASRLVKSVRKVFRIRPRPPRTAPDCVREGYTYRLTHATYGPLKVLAEDQGVSWYVIEGRSIWESDLVKIFEREIRGSQNVLDVGANLGLHTILLSRHVSQLGQGGKAIAIEPHPEIFPLTAFNCAALANIECINKAASDVGGSLFYMPSILSHTNAGGVGVVTDRQEGMFQVESVTVDSLALDNLGFMKVDVEGHELSCIQGATETIHRCRPTMVIEIMGGHCLQTAPPLIAAEIRRRIEFVCGLGYMVEQVSVHDYLFRPR
jgi:FkbM family methyltransferase